MACYMEKRCLWPLLPEVQAWSAAAYLASRGLDVIGVDNDMRKYFFGREASTRWNRELLERSLGIIGMLKAIYATGRLWTRGVGNSARRLHSSFTPQRSLLTTGLHVNRIPISR